MNNFKRQEAIDELEAGHSKRELAAMVLDLRQILEGQKIPNGAKAGCIGEFSVHIENGGVCPECYNGHCDEGANSDCEICHGESFDGLYDVSYDIPWITQKEIFKAFCKYAAQEISTKQGE